MHEWRLKLYRGKYAIYWREDGRTRRCSLGATNRLEAQGRAKDYFRAVDLAQAPTFTVADLWARYRESLEGRPSHTTMGYEERAILPHFGDLLPHHITDEACEEYIAKRRAVGRKDGTILTEMNRLSNALNRAVKEGLLPRVPIIKRPSVPPPRDRYLTKDEARTFLAGVDAPHFRLFCILALTTAARLEAILGLRWDRVDMGRRRLNLQDPARQAMTKGRAIVPINDRLYAELAAAWERDGIRTGSTAYVVQYRGGRVGSIKTALAQTIRRSGVMGVTAHVFRHTAAVWMAEDGVPMEEISQYLGHRGTEVTRKVYARFSPEYLRKAAGSLDF